MNKKLVLVLVVIVISACAKQEQPTDVIAPTETPEPGSTWTNPIDQAVAAYIPAGEFEMGSPDAKPVHTVYLDAFWMYQTEVTNYQYSLCVENGACNLPEDTYRYDNDNDIVSPVVWVSWDDALNYCEWAGGRLPMEAEWEKAARGGLVGQTFPWGNTDPNCRFEAVNGANTRLCELWGEPIMVGRFAPNGYGLYDMIGNVREWVADWYDGDYYNNSPYKNPTGPTSGEWRVIRGGNFYYYISMLSVADREYLGPDLAWSDLGFRCVTSP